MNNESERSSAQEIGKSLTYLRLVILVDILLHVAFLLPGFVSNRKNIAGLIAAAIASFLLYKAPDLIILFGIRNKAQSWMISLAVVFPMLEAFFRMIFVLGNAGIWQYLPASIRIRDLSFNSLGLASDVVVAIFAWRAWREWQPAGRSSGSALQVIIWSAVSCFYLLLVNIIVRFTTPLFYRFVHY